MLTQILFKSFTVRYQKKNQIQLMLLSFYTFWHTLLVVIVGFIFIYLSTYFILFLFVFNLAILNLVPCIQTNLHFLNYYSMSLHMQGVYGSGENTSVYHMFGIVLTVLFFSFSPPPLLNIQVWQLFWSWQCYLNTAIFYWRLLMFIVQTNSLLSWCSTGLNPNYSKI